MDSGLERRFFPQGGVDGLGLGVARGSHPVSGLGGALAQCGRRIVVGVCLGLIIALVFIRPSSAFVKGLCTAAVALVLLGLTQVWRRLSARFGLRRCYLFSCGLVVTNAFGRVHDVVLWTDVAALNHMSNQSGLLSFHRFEIVRHGSGLLPLLALGANPPLVEALLTETRNNGLGQRTV
jgi:hypothetical protein